MKQFLTGNILLILCCAFYLTWWLIAFKPAGAVKGLKSGWLLIPAAVFGIAAVLIICRAVSATENESMLLPTARIVMIGIAAYAVLLAGTWLILKRPVTTELFLIVGWTVLAVTQVSALYGRGAFGRSTASGLIACIIIMAVISLICYLLYYNLDSIKGYYDGMIPLVIVAVMTAVISFAAR